MKDKDIVIVSEFDGNDFKLSYVEYSEVMSGDSYLHNKNLMRKCVDDDDVLIVSLDDEDIVNIDKLI